LKPNCKQLCRIKLKSDVYMQNLSVCPDAKASPFGRGVTAGDGEGKLSATEPPRGDRQPLCQSETIATSAILWQRPCPLRRFAPALPKGEPFKMKGVFAIYPKNLSKFWKINLKAFSHKSGKLCYNHNYGRGRGCAALTENNEEGGEPYGTVPLQALWCDQKRR
jgi:hypothetical protein